MDLILDLADTHVLDRVYESLLPAMGLAAPARDVMARQFASLYLITLVGGYLIYFGFATLAYYTVFDHRDMRHPRFLPNQVRREIACAAGSIPLMTLFTAPIFVAEVRGYSALYDDARDYGGPGYVALSCVTFLMFTDMLIYWFHRWMHHRSIYALVHKPHHAWVIPTPFASHAFHPVDGFIQSLPYHIYVFLFPLHKITYIGLFVFVNVWTVSIHDGRHVLFDAIVNGAAHHTLHHTGFKYNYGQYFTLWDRIGGSYKKPTGDPKNQKFD
jgi:lathosterol oxidase